MVHSHSETSIDHTRGIEPPADVQPGLESQEFEGQAPDTKAASKLAFEVRFSDNSTRDYDLEGLRAAIIEGGVRRTDEVRTDRSEDNWVTVDVLKDSLGYSFQVLYSPISAHTAKGLSYGAAAGIGLKSLDSLYMLWEVQPVMAWYFLLIIGSIVAARSLPIAPIAAAVYTAIMVPGTNLWFVLLGAAFFGVIFGGPLGALIGTIVGRIRKSSLVLAHDAENEGSSVFIWGVLTPIISLAILVYLYIHWFMPWIMGLAME